MDANQVIKNVVFDYERMSQEVESLHEQVEFYRTELENALRDNEAQRARVAARCAENLDRLGYHVAADIVRTNFGIGGDKS